MKKKPAQPKYPSHDNPTTAFLNSGFAPFAQQRIQVKQKPPPKKS